MNYGRYLHGRIITQSYWRRFLTMWNTVNGVKNTHVCVNIQQFLFVCVVGIHVCVDMPCTNVFLYVEARRDTGYLSTVFYLILWGRIPQWPWRWPARLTGQKALGILQPLPPSTRITGYIGLHLPFTWVLGSKLRSSHLCSSVQDSTHWDISVLLRISFWNLCMCTYIHIYMYMYIYSYV